MKRSGVLSTAMSFLGLYRDPSLPMLTRRCDWRIDDLIEGGSNRPTLYLVVPPSDISPHQAADPACVESRSCRRLTERLERHAAAAIAF